MDISLGGLDLWEADGFLVILILDSTFRGYLFESAYCDCVVLLIKTLYSYRSLKTLSSRRINAYWQMLWSSERKIPCQSYSHSMSEYDLHKEKFHQFSVDDRVLITCEMD